VSASLDSPDGHGADLPADLPADPDAYDSPRAVQARARGLAAPYIAGGLDPDMDTTRRRERRYVRILIAMIVVVVLSGFVLGYIANILGFGT
jgi:hypothetical protein